MFDNYPELNSFSHLDKVLVNPPDDLLKLYIPNGKKPYDGLVLDKNNSNDGQEHEIHSFEDYKKHSRWYPYYVVRDKINKLIQF